MIWGGARPTAFMVDLFSPFSSENQKRARLFITAASLPSFTVQQAVVPYFGAQIKFSAERIYENWDVVVQNDEDFPIRAMLEKWSNDMNGLISNRLNPERYPTGYKTTAEVTQMAKDGSKPLRIYKMSGLWPVQVGAIQLDWSAAGQIEMFQVSFSIDYFECFE